MSDSNIEKLGSYFVDTYADHATHLVYRTDCSECYKQAPQVEINQEGDIVLSERIEVDIGEEDTVCEFCNGTGKIACDHRDSEGNWESGTDEQLCECQLDNEPADFSGVTNEDR